MTEFVASNGNKIRYDETGLFVEGISINDGKRLFSSQVTALREFFQHERDIELGRWRSKEHPEYVVYPIDGADSARLFDERDGIHTDVTRESAQRLVGDWDGYMAAAEFFAAHPEPKPWKSAKPGEVWALTFSDGSTDAFKVDIDMAKHIASWGAVNSITAGRRIWPEVSE